MTIFEEIDGLEDTPSVWVQGGEYFYVRAVDNSMIHARIHDGDLLLFRKQDDVEEGHIAAVLINENVLLKRVFKVDGILVLHSENIEYGSILWTTNNQDTIRIVGKLKKIIIDL